MLNFVFLLRTSANQASSFALGLASVVTANMLGALRPAALIIQPVASIGLTPIFGFLNVHTMLFFKHFCYAYPPPTLGLRYAYTTEVEKSALKEAVFNTILLETLQRPLEALAGIHRHALYAKGFLDLSIGADIILGEFAQTLRVQWQVQSTANRNT